MLTDVEKAILRLTTLKDLFDDLSVNSNVVSVLLDREDERALKTAIEALREQRPHGEWVGEFHPTCSVCGDFSPIDSNENPYDSNFCPNCGADMREEGDSDD